MTNEQDAEYAFIIEESVRIIDSAIDGEYVIGPTGLTNALNDLRRTADALRAPQGWQPIATALKDGWVACGYWYDEGCWVWGRGRYHYDEHHPEGYFIMEGGGKPTHWQSVLPPVSPVTEQE